MIRSPCILILAFIPGLFKQATAQVAADPASRERDLNSFLQAHVSSYQGQRVTNNVHFFLGRGNGQDAQPQAGPPAAVPNSYVQPTSDDVIPPDYWKDAEKTLVRASMSTPLPLSAEINAAPATPTPKPWTDIMLEPAQPLDTKVGAQIMDKLSGPVTPTPPPSQDVTEVQFIAQCPMVMFKNQLSIRAPTCGSLYGSWVDPSPLNPRPVLRWEGLPASGIRMGVDSAVDGHGAARFAEITQEMTLNSYKFIMTNCLGIDRWHIEELVYKVDSVGKVSSTMELHDVNLNSVAYFYRYVIKKPTGVIVAESTLYRRSSLHVNFTEVNSLGINTGKIVAMVSKQGEWSGTGWRQCMAPTSPRGWLIDFPYEQPSAAALNATGATSVSTVQDIRVAIAGVISLMGHRDEGRVNGLNTEGGQQQMAMLAGGIMLVFAVCILGVNCCMVFKGAGLKDKLKRTLFDTQGSVLPKQPTTHRAAPFHPSY